MSNYEQTLEKANFDPLTRFGKGYYLWMALLLALIGLGIYAFIYQYRQGLGATGMRDNVFWGVYIINFVFLIGISHAGTFIAAVLRVTGQKWSIPVTRMAEAMTVFALLFGVIMIIADLGRVDRLLNIIMYGRFQSPLVWDVVAVTSYLTGSIICLYLALIPDIARCRDRLRGISRIRYKLYEILAVGWQGTPEHHRLLNKSLMIMSVIIIAVMVSVHTVVSWVFSMTLRPGWHSTIFGPYFVIGAIFSGVAAVITIMAVLRYLNKLDKYITVDHFRKVGYIMTTAGVLYVYFTVSEYWTEAYKMEEGVGALLTALFYGEYALLFWSWAIPGTLIPILLVALPWTRSIAGITIASVLVNIGMWIKRYVIVVPSLAVPQMSYEWGQYAPTWVEISILVGAYAGFLFLYSLFIKLFPILPVWEMVEHQEEMITAGEYVPGDTGKEVPVTAK